MELPQADIDQGMQSLVTLRRELRSLREKREELFSQVGEVAEGFWSQSKDCETVADWLAQNLEEVAQSLTDTTSLSSDDREIFAFLMGQLLERIEHCQFWGREDILQDTDFPLHFDHVIYVRALQQLSPLIPPGLPSQGVESLLSYVNCLIENLPNYKSHDEPS